MGTYITRRLLLLLPTVLLVSFVVFLVIHLIPSSTVDDMAERVAYGDQATFDKFKAMILKELGLDVPLFTQYGRWMGFIPQDDGSFSGIIQGDFGQSFWTKTSVLQEILTRWPVTIELTLIALVLSQMIALPIGIYSALRQDTWGDYMTRGLALLCISVPGFWIGTLVIVLPSLWWGYMPPLQYIPFIKDPMVNLAMFIPPAVVMGLLMAGTTMRMTRSMMLDVLRQDYIRTAWAKGLRERVVIIRHALKNALIPVITIIGVQTAVLVGGSVITEQIFCLPGMGRLLISAVNTRDYPLVSGLLIFFAVWMILINLVVDITYSYMDPRIRYK